MDGIQDRPKVGVGVLIVRNGLVLLGNRITGHGAGTVMIPGGHLEFGESFEEAAVRETKEECGLEDLEVGGLVSVSNDIEYGKHYVSIGILVKSEIGEPYNAEPEKCSDWYWCDPKDLPENMFIHSRRVIENWLSGEVYRK
jgi:8-oxo-dGTP diphosphatase